MKIAHLQFQNHSSQISNVHAKFEENQSKTTPVKNPETTFLHKSRVLTLLFINKFSPFAIQNHSSQISMSMQSLKKIGQILLKLESGNEILTDGRMDGQMDRHSKFQHFQRV